MAKTFLSACALLLLLCSASATTDDYFRHRQQQQLQRQCDITRINALEPSFRLQSEGGLSEFWDHHSDEFQCAGVSLHRHTIKTRGLLLPVYHNAPILAYVLQGRGIFGVMISGCPETFESPQQSSEGMKSQRFRDRHQKVEQLRQGDVVAIRAGDAHWVYNNGEEDLIVVVLQDNSNFANQLDQHPRSFFLAGNPEWGQEQQQQQQRFRGERRQGQHEFGNIFKGFGVETLSEVFDVDQETARKLQSENDERGLIVIAERGLQVIKPPSYREEEEEEREFPRRNENGLEETICSAKIKENIDNPSRSDIYNPQAGRFSTVNSFTLPILTFLKLSFAKGVLYKNAMMAPHWFVNAHKIMYVTRGESHIQVVNHNGQAMFDGEVREGQVIVVPQNFAVVKQAGEQGFEWVEFQTNENAMYNTLNGRTSALRGLPLDVVANAYQMSREEAEKVKFSRGETLFFSGSRFSRRHGRVASA